MKHAINNSPEPFDFLVLKTYREGYIYKNIKRNTWKIFLLYFYRKISLDETNRKQYQQVVKDVSKFR